MMETVAQIIGFFAMATVVASLQVKNPRGTLWVMAAATGLFSLHFGLLGAITGCILNALNVLRNLAILFTEPKSVVGRLAKHTLSFAYMVAPFGFYRIALGAAVLAYFLLT